MNVFQVMNERPRFAPVIMESGGARSGAVQAGSEAGGGGMAWQGAPARDPTRKRLTAANDAPFLCKSHWRIRRRIIERHLHVSLPFEAKPARALSSTLGPSRGRALVERNLHPHMNNKHPLIDNGYWRWSDLAFIGACKRAAGRVGVGTLYCTSTIEPDVNWIIQSAMEQITLNISNSISITLIKFRSALFLGVSQLMC